MAKNPIYTDDPKSIRYMGRRYVLAADEGDETKKTMRPSSARVRVDRCRHSGVKFVVEALVLDAKNRVPQGGRATISDGDFSLTVRPIRNDNQIPSDVWDNLPDDANGTAVRQRIEKALAKKGGDTTSVGKGLFLIQAEGGWNWGDAKHGLKGVDKMHELLKYISKDRPALLYVYCSNSMA